MADTLSERLRQMIDDDWFDYNSGGDEMRDRVECALAVVTAAEAWAKLKRQDAPFGQKMQHRQATRDAKHALLALIPQEIDK